MEHRGEIVIAQLLDTVKDTFYKFRTRIETGHETGKGSYVVYRGNPPFVGGNVIIRLENPNTKKSSLDLDGHVTGNFVTSSIPNDFEFLPSEETILYGIWEERMRSGYSTPKGGRISNFFDIGIMSSILHYSYREGRIVPYNAASVVKPQVSGHETTRSVDSALWLYLNRFSNFPDSPRLVTIDEKIDLESIILPTFDKIIKSPEFSIVRTIQMEPQQ